MFDLVYTCLTLFLSTMFDLIYTMFDLIYTIVDTTVTGVQGLLGIYTRVEF